MTSLEIRSELPEGAVCAVHPEVVATDGCTRCGNFCCVECVRATDAGAYCVSCVARVGFERPAIAHFGEASQLQRLLNFGIDAMMVQLFAGLLGWRSGIAVPTFVWLFFYYLVFETLTGRTLGKIATETRVVTVRAEHPSFKAVLLRSLSRCVPFEAFSFLNGNHRGWHDRWSKTRVVRLARPPAYDPELALPLD